MSELDRAIMEYRKSPTDANRAAVMAAQEKHHQNFLKLYTAELMAKQYRPSTCCCGEPEHVVIRHRNNR